MFGAEIWKKIRIFIWKSSFLVVKFSVYLNRHVFVMENHRRTNKEESQQRNRLGMVSGKTTWCWVCVLGWGWGRGSCTLSVKQHSETHIMKDNVVKQNKELYGDLKPEHKITTNRTTMSSTTLIVRHGPSETDWGGSRHLVWGQIHRREIKDGSKAINHNWVNNHVYSLPKNIHVVSYLLLCFTLESETG